MRNVLRFIGFVEYTVVITHATYTVAKKVIRKVRK